MSDAAINEAAEERLLADIDNFTEWLGNHCAGQERVCLPFVPSDRSRVQELIDGFSVPQLVALSLYPCADVAGLAMRELRQRYINEAPIYLAKLTEEIAADLQGDEPMAATLVRAADKANVRRFTGEAPTGWGALA